MGLSATTISELNNIIINNTDAKTDVVAFIQKFSLGEASLELSRAKNLANIQPNLLAKSDGIIDILEHVINWYYIKHPDAGNIDILGNKNNDILDDYPNFLRYLKNDGFVIRNRRITKALPKEIESAEIQDELDLYLTKYELITTKGHLDQATDNIKLSNWAAANGQIRTFFESLLIEIVKKIDPKSTINSGGNAIDFLSKKEFFKKNLNEIDENNSPYGFIKGMWKILHTEGSHPGLSESGDCTFRYHLLLVTATYYLKRLEKFIEETK